MLLNVLGGLFTLVGFVCSIIVLIAAFKDEIWKGVVGLLCGLYLLYYAIFEYGGDNKGLVLGGLVLGMIGGGLLRAAGGMTHVR